MNMGGAPANDGMFSEFLNVFMEGEGEVGGGGMPQQQQQQQQQMGGYGMSQPQVRDLSNRSLKYWCCAEGGCHIIVALPTIVVDLAWCSTVIAIKCESVRPAC